MDGAQKNQLIGEMESLIEELQKKADQLDKSHRSTNEVRKTASGVAAFGAGTSLACMAGLALAPQTRAFALAGTAGGYLVALGGSAVSSTAEVNRGLDERAAQRAMKQKLQILVQKVEHGKAKEAVEILSTEIWTLSKSEMAAIIKSLKVYWGPAEEMFVVVKTAMSGKAKVGGFANAIRAAGGCVTGKANFLLLAVALYDFWDSSAQLEHITMSETACKMRRVAVIMERICVELKKMD